MTYFGSLPASPLTQLPLFWPHLVVSYRIPCGNIWLTLRTDFPLKNILSSSPSLHTTYHSFQWFQFNLKFWASHLPVSKCLLMSQEVLLNNTIPPCPQDCSNSLFFSRCTLFLSPDLPPGWPVLGHQFHSILVFSISVLDSETCLSHLSRTPRNQALRDSPGVASICLLDPDLCWFMIPLLLYFTHMGSGYC